MGGGSRPTSSPRRSSSRSGICHARWCWAWWAWWQQTNFIAEEIIEPERNLPRALVLGVVGVVAADQLHRRGDHRAGAESATRSGAGRGGRGGSRPTSSPRRSSSRSGICHALGCWAWWAWWQQTNFIAEEIIEPERNLP